MKRATIAVLIGCLLLCGCEGGKDSTSESESTTTTAATAVTDASAESGSGTAATKETTPKRQRILPLKMESGNLQFPMMQRRS